MKIEKDTYLKLLFKNGVWVEGVVVSWSDEESLLRTPDGSEVIIISPKENLMLIKKIQKRNPKSIKDQFDKLVDSPSDDINRVTKIADLKVMLNQAEKEIILEKSRSHTVSSDVRNVEYGNPGFFKK